MKRNSAILTLSVLVVVGVTVMGVRTAADAQGPVSFLSNYIFASGCTEDSSFCIQINMTDEKATICSEGQGPFSSKHRHKFQKAEAGSIWPCLLVCVPGMACSGFMQLG
jgi:hypothetical protein